MSVVTNLILTTGPSGPEDGSIDRGVLFVNRWLKESGHGEFYEATNRPAQETTDWRKYMECDVYLLAANHFDLDALLDVLDRAPFDPIDTVQLLVKEDHDTEFRQAWRRGHLETRNSDPARRRMMPLEDL